MKFIYCLVLLAFVSLSAKDRYEVDMVAIEYVDHHPELSTANDLRRVNVTFGMTPSGFKQPHSALPQQTLAIDQIGMDGPVWLYRDALVAIGQALVKDFNRRGIYGVTVTVDPLQINREGEDLRAPGHKGITFLIYISKIQSIRTVQEGNIDQKRHEHIKRYAPATESDLLYSEEIEEYIFYLNRHPNRRVDLEIGTASVPGMASVDIVISEDKPWRIYGNVSNTGPDTIENWQQIFGFVNTQLTHFDDTLLLDYATDSFNQYNSVILSYTRPFASARRVRWGLSGTYRRFDAAQLGFSGRAFRGDFWEAQYGVDWNIYQKRDFFADLLVNAQYNYISVDNRLNEIKGHEDFVIPQIGLRFSRLRLTSSLFLETTWEAPINGITGVKQRNLDRLGRADVDKWWSVWSGMASASTYLEALFQKPNYQRLAHEVFTYLTWQSSFNARLIPEYENVIGGLYSVRGYPTATFAGDSTITATAEYRLHIAQLFGPHPTSRPLKIFGKPFRVTPQYPGGRADWDFIVRLFCDVGAVSVKQSNHAAQDPQGTLVGMGIGGEFIFRRNLFIRGDFAWALKDANNPTVENISAGNFEPYFSATVMY